MWAATEVRARIVDITRENPDSEAAEVATLTLQPTSTWRGHRAGQYVQVGVELPGSSRRMARVFSISSAESDPGERFTLTIRAHEEGQVSKYLVRDAKPGEILHLNQAEGDFTLPGSPATPSPYPLLMISGGSGITPVMSQIRTLLRDGYDGKAQRKVTFLHFAGSPEDQIFRDELAEIAAADNHIDVHLRYGDQRFSEFELTRLVPDFQNTDTWACGPAGLIELVTDGLRAAATSSASSSSSRRSRRGAARPRVTSRSSTSGKQAANTGASLLEQAEALGLEPGVRLPDGHLLLLHRDEDRGHRQERAHRRGVLLARRRDPHLREHARRRLLRQPLRVSRLAQRSHLTTETNH